MHIVKLRIPPQQHAATKDFLDLSEKSMEDLLSILSKAPPVLQVSDLADYVDKKAKIGAGKTRRILKMLASLYTVRVKSGMTIQEFVKEFRLAAEKEKFEPKSQSWEAIERHLSQILSLDQSLGVTSKALDVMTEHNNVFVGARILTDLRAVFTPDPAEPPSAATLFHILKISYHESGSHKEFYVVLDSNDIKELQSVLQRATLKETGLKKLIEKLKIPLIDVETQKDL